MRIDVENFMDRLSERIEQTQEMTRLGRFYIGKLEGLARAKEILEEEISRQVKKEAKP